MLIITAIFGIILFVFGIYWMITETPETYARRKAIEAKKKRDKGIGGFIFKYTLFGLFFPQKHTWWF